MLDDCVEVRFNGLPQLCRCPSALLSPLTREIRRPIPNPDLSTPSTPYSTFTLTDGFPAF
jgi:hypothetical protein